MKFIISPKISRITSRTDTGNLTSYTTVDLGRTIHVGAYGIIDDFFEYFIDEDEDKEIIAFLKTNKDKLQFKIRGYPYKDTDVRLLEN